MRLYRSVALVLATVFAAVGIVFLVGPQWVRDVFEWAARVTAVPALPAGQVEPGLFRALAVAYMYVVALLAWMMNRRPADPVWATLLAHAKLASATASAVLLVAMGPSLILAANAVVDGLIGVLALVMRRQVIGMGDGTVSPGTHHEHPPVPA